MLFPGVTGGGRGIGRASDYVTIAFLTILVLYWLKQPTDDLLSEWPPTWLKRCLELAKPSQNLPASLGAGPEAMGMSGQEKQGQTAAATLTGQDKSLPTTMCPGTAVAVANQQQQLGRAAG